MNNLFKQNSAKLCRAALAITVLLALLFRILALLFSFDAQIGYFQKGSILILLTYVLEGISVALCAALPFLINNARVRGASASPGVAELIGAIFTAMMLPITAAYLLLKGRTGLVAPALLSILAALLCLIGIGFFVTRLFSFKQDTRALFGYALIFGAALLMMIAYLDRYTQTNAPHKLSQHLCMLCMMLAVLYEARALVGRDLPRVRLAVTALAFALCGIFSLSNLIAFCAGAYDDLTYLVCDLPALGFAIYSGARLFSAIGEEVEA